MDEVVEFCAICCLGLYELSGTSKEVVDSVKLTLVNNGFTYQVLGMLYLSMPLMIGTLCDLIADTKAIRL